MSDPVLLACLWCVLANIIAMFPSKHKHWPAFYVLMAFGLPILSWVFVNDGLIFGLIFTVAGISIFRWPVLFFLRWLKARMWTRAEP
jgi:hypothetical protein